MTPRDFLMKEHKLTPREAEITTLVAGGMSYQDIADKLNISYRSAVAHMPKILFKTGVKDRINLVVWWYTILLWDVDFEKGTAGHAVQN